MATPGALVQHRVIPGGYGAVVIVDEGHYLKVIDAQGGQTCSLIVLDPAEPRRFLSGSHTRVHLAHKLEISRTLVHGEPLLDNTRHPMLLVAEDTAGVHDWLLPACDAVYYASEHHLTNQRNCRMNFIEAAAEFAILLPVIPDPLNLFQKSSWKDSGKLLPVKPTSKAGDYVLFRALRPLLAVGSACPENSVSRNARPPTEIIFEVYAPAARKKRKDAGR
jgi:uncharacterized protein YcgI (DUF1989 family)